MTAWIVIGGLVVVALILLLRRPFAEWRRHRAAKAQEAKRQWRRDRDAAKAQRSVERAMNPAKAAAKSGPPKPSQVIQRSGSKCWLCGTRTFDDDRVREKNGTERLGATYPIVDYVTPLDRGGTYELENARIAHRHCASVRAAQPGRTEFGKPRRTYPARA